MKRTFKNIVISVLTIAALSLSAGTFTAFADDAGTAQQSYLAPFESRYDLTSTGLSVDNLDFAGVKEIKTNAEWEEYVKACVDRGYHFVFFKASPELTFDLNSFMNKNNITYVVTHKITRAGVTVTGYEITYTFSYDILTAIKIGKESALSEKQKQVLQTAREFLAGLPEGISDYDKELAIHNYVCEKVSYTDDRSKENVTDCYGGLILGRGNCMAYTDSFNLLCGLAGFDTGRVMCTVDSGFHTLNYIVINGEYYFVDCTFDDGIDSARGYGVFYFNQPYSIISKRHILQDVPFELKPGTNSEGYYQHTGTYADSPAELKQVYKKLADASLGGEILFYTGNGSASLLDAFREYHPKGKDNISVSSCIIGEYQIIRFSLS